MKVVAVIPCYNESKYIGEIVKRTMNYVSQVVVVDNGSLDDTVVRARESGATVVYSHRKGMGAAIKKGINQFDADIYLTMDGDGQHNPDEIPQLIAPILQDKADFAVGIRENNGSMPKYRKLVNDLLCVIYNLGSPLKLKDVQCGFRAFDREVKQIHIESFGFSCVFELLCKVRKLKLRIVPVQVCCIYHGSLSQNSTLNPIKHGIIALTGAIKWRIWELFKT